MDNAPWIPKQQLELARRHQRRASVLGLLVVAGLHALLLVLAIWFVRPFAASDTSQVFFLRGLGVWILTVQSSLVMVWSAASSASAVRRISGGLLAVGLIFAILARGVGLNLDFRDVVGLLLSVAVQAVLVAGPLLIARAGGRRLQWFSDPPDDWRSPRLELRWSLRAVLAWTLLLCLALAGARGAYELRHDALNWSAAAGAVGYFATLLAIPWSMVAVLGVGPPWTRWPIALGVLLAGQMVEAVLWVVTDLDVKYWRTSLAAVFLSVAVETVLIALPTLPVYAAVRRAGYRWLRAEAAIEQDPA